MPAEYKTDRDRWVCNMRDLLDLAVERGWVDDTEEYETNIVDLLADLMHYCDEEKIDFWYCLQTAQGHFNEEVREGN